MAQNVLSKMTPNGKVRLYMPQREFIDFLAGIQPIDGAVVVKSDYLDPDRLIAVQLMTAVRFGREDDEVMGVNLSRELCLASIVVNQAQPPEKLTKMQDNLVSTYGETCFPFHIEWPKDVAASMYIEQLPGATGEPCGIHHYIEVFCLYKGAQPHKRSSIRLDLNVIQLPSDGVNSGMLIPPAVAITHPLFLGCGRVQLEVCLEKTTICDEEPLVINITIANHSSKTLRKLKATLMQMYEVTFAKGERKVPVTSLKSVSGFPIAPGGTLNQTLTLFPRVPIGPQQDGVAVRLIAAKSTRTQLASSTLFADSQKNSDKFGFIISYRVVVKVSAHPAPLKAGVVAQVPIYIVARKPLKADLAETSSIGSGHQVDYMELRQRKQDSTPKIQKRAFVPPHQSCGMEASNKISIDVQQLV